MTIKQASGQSQTSGWMGNLSFRVKLVAAFLVMILTTVGILAYWNNQLSRSNLTQAANYNLLNGASQTAARLDDFVQSNLGLVRTQAQLPIFARYLGLASTKNVSNELATEVKTIFQIFASRNPVHIYSHALLNKHGVNLIDNRGINIGRNESNQAYFQEVIRTGLPYVSPVQHVGDNDVVLLINFTAPIRDPLSEEIIGLLRLSFEANVLQSIIGRNNDLVGSEAFAVLLDENHIRLAHGTRLNLVLKSVVPLNPERAVELQAAGRLPKLPLAELSTDLPEFEQGLNRIDEQRFFEAYLEEVGQVNVAAVKMETRPWLVMFAQPKEVYIAPINAQTQTILLLATVLTIVMTLTSLAVARWLTGPITHLIEVVNRVRDGDLTAQAEVETNDEIGLLATTFNSMIERIRQILHDLEDRSRQLETVAVLSERFNALLNLDQLLPEMVNQIQAKFGYYHTHIYLLNEHGNTLDVVEGIGEAGRVMKAQGHTIPLNAPASLVARAARRGEVVSVANVRETVDWLPDKLLPDTYAEMAVPIHNENKILGVLDVQSDKIAGLDDGDANLLRSLANQIGIALNNAHLYQELAKLNADKDRFFSILGHDLKGPFQPLLGNAEFLVEMAEILPPAEIKSMSNSILASGKRVLELLENLLQWSQFQMGRMEYTPEVLDVAQVAAKIVALLEEVAKTKEIHLENKVSEGIQVYADEQMLATVIRNLANNALKFTSAGDSVLVEASSNGHEVEIQVRDSGVGMSAEHQATLFEVGVNSSTSGTANEQGTGLGLLMCQEMVALNGGRIWVESQLGEGTTVKFTLPKGSGGAKLGPENLPSTRKNSESLLQSTPPVSSDEQKQYEQVIRLSEGMNRSAEQVYKLLEEMVSWVKDELLDLRYEPEKLVLSELVTTIFAELNHQSQQQEVELINQVSEGITVYSDRRLLGVILQGLMLNGLKFSPRGGNLFVKSQLVQVDDGESHVVEISVSDQGQGWQERETSRLFNEYIYHQLSGERQRTQIGLGLMIYDELVRRNGGQLWVESEVGQGTTVHLTVPCDTCKKEN